MHDRFLRACRRQRSDTTPVWFMRQAGRYMAEYRALRAEHSMLELCRTPELALQVTLQPIRALAVDAAILFADILLPLEPMGAPFEFAKGEGPVVHAPVRPRHGVIPEAVRTLDAAGVGIDDISLHRPTLDDVFITLTGHAAEDTTGESEEEKEAAAA